jgi:MSHA biogenesis protein MshQ
VLASEIESFDRTGIDPLVAWVKVPSLAATADTTLYVYYGHPSPPAPAPAQAPEAVWTADYLGVWHLQQDPAVGGPGNIRDATSGNLDGTAMDLDANDSVDAKIGRGLSFNGTDEHVNFGLANFGNAFTISMWVRIANSSNVRSLLSNSASGADSDGFRLFVNTVGTANRRIIFETGNGGGGGGGNVGETAENAITQDVFAHVAAVVNRTAGTLKIYIDGQDRTEDGNILNTFQTNSDFEVGRFEDGLAHFPGILDEIQLSSTQRTIEWIRTSFNNQSQPGTFHTLGTEERRP